MTLPSQTGRLSAQDIRWLFGATAVIGGVTGVLLPLIDGMASAPQSISALLLAMLALAANTAVAVWPIDVPPLLLRAAFAANILAVTGTVHVSGGADAVSAVLLYALVIALAGLVLDGRAAYWVAGLAIVSYDGLLLLESYRLVSQQAPSVRPIARQIVEAVLVNAYFALFALLVSRVVGLIRGTYERADAMRTEALGALSHDLKTPLGVVHGFADMLEDTATGEARDTARRIKSAAQQAIDLVRNVLDTARIDGITPTLNREPIDLNAVASEAARLYDFAVDDRALTLATALCPDMPVVEADRHLLARAIGNLLSNAIKFTAPGGRVSLATSRTATAATIAVSDTGRGMTADECARLFQPYTRVDSSRGIEGTGLGLFIVRRIVEAHGGRVTVESAPGAGTTFTLHLPVGAAA